MKAYVFPGQGAQFEGMGRDMYEESPIASEYFNKANEILGFNITDVMFDGTADELRATNIAQPAIFLHSFIKAKMEGERFQPDVVAGHSLGEFSALTAAEALSFENGLQLVCQRAAAMQKACELVDGTMAAVIGFDNEKIEEICAEIDDVVVPANYNSYGQLVISGSLTGIEKATNKLNEAGAGMVIALPVGGAFHSPLMQPAREELSRAIQETSFKKPSCPIYQNVTAMPETDPQLIQNNLIEQLTAPVLWTQTIENMLADGIDSFVEVGGRGDILRGLIMKIDRKMQVDLI